MTYKKNFVCAIKVNGKVLRESSDRVELPFGSEYSILLKNLDTVRVQAKVSIDGDDATGWLVVSPNSSIDVERFVKDLDRGNRFKFIERTDAVENHRGVKLDDGLIRVEFRREKVFETPKIVYHYPYYPYGVYVGNFCSTLNQNSNTFRDGGETRGRSFQGHQNVNTTLTNSGSAGSSGAFFAMNMSHSVEAPVNDAGITVPGSLSNQKFISVSGFATEQSEVIVLHLIGKKAGSPVQVAKTVHTMLQCETCGKTSKSSAKFCKECGTSLERV
jgi:hypothetical protein